MAKLAQVEEEVEGEGEGEKREEALIESEPKRRRRAALEQNGEPLGCCPHSTPE